MWHAVRGGLVVAGQRTPARYRCPATAPAGHSAACCRREGDAAAAASTAVAACGTTRTPVSGDGAIVEALGGDVAQAGDHLVAERAGGEGRVGLDQRTSSADRHGAGSAPRWHRRTRRRSRRYAARPGRARRARRGRWRGGMRRVPWPPPPRPRKGGGRSLAAVRSPREGCSALHFCAAHQTAIAWSSSGVKPLTMRVITVAGRLPARNDSNSATRWSG